MHSQCPTQVCSVWRVTTLLAMGGMLSADKF